MVGNAGSSSSSANAPYFNGEGYNLWSLKMETLLLSRKLWGIVNKGFDEEDDDVQRLEDDIQKNAKALISRTRVAKKAWDILKKEYQGCSKSSAVKLHTYRQEYENLRMKNGKSVQDYISRVLTTTYHIQALSKELDEKAIASKILRSLSPKFHHVVSSIVKAKDLSILTVDKLSGSLKGHEGRLDMESDKVEVRAFHIKGEEEEEEVVAMNIRILKGERWQNKADIQCYKCKKFGHYKSQCWYKDIAVNVVEEEAKVTHLFMADSGLDDQHEDVWLLDNGCSNHITGIKSLFQTLDESMQQTIRLGDNPVMKVGGMGKVRMKTKGGQMKELHQVLYMPKLAHNLLSVG
ncbi:uncharacterized protein LOC120274929 [Dioscorea cayenensis subsp. rotundata]|uniref:Uncharacterized protein LOC120274929 n=1 Tax=Dioscorea cayennensis subsp. rotundata TaxID=55577 RepID=A0AB40CBX0_DIOCR|nr:uncharacterized protein LOC120274929 [Dioscorea cayenensis subsp. rotundata]